MEHVVTYRRIVDRRGEYFIDDYWAAGYTFKAVRPPVNSDLVMELNSTRIHLLESCEEVKEG